MCFFFSSRRRHTRFDCDWSSDVCSSDLFTPADVQRFKESGINVFHIGVGLGGADPHGNTLRFLASWNGFLAARSEERRVGKECRSRSSPDRYKKKSCGTTERTTPI